MTRNSSLLLLLFLVLGLALGSALHGDEGERSGAATKAQTSMLPSRAAELDTRHSIPLALPKDEGQTVERKAEVQGLLVRVELVGAGSHGSQSTTPGGSPQDQVQQPWTGELLAVSGDSGQALAHFLALTQTDRVPHGLLEESARFSIAAGGAVVTGTPTNPTLFVAMFSNGDTSALGAVYVDPASLAESPVVHVIARPTRLAWLQVQNESEQPQPGARIVLRGFGATAGEHLVELKADEEGKASFFHLDALSWHGAPDWTWDLQALWGRAKSAREAIEMDQEKRVTRVQLGLTDKVDVTVLLKDERGNGVFGPEVTLLVNRPELSILASRSQGRFLLRGLQEGQSLYLRGADSAENSWSFVPMTVIVQSGEEPTQTVHLQARFTGFNLTGTLFHEDGTPFASKRFIPWSHLAWPSGLAQNSGLGRYETDEHGRFVLRIEPSSLGWEGEQASMAKFAFHYNHGQANAFSVTAPDVAALVAIPPGELGQEIDLGQLVFAKPKTLFWGRVLDPQGKPVEGARIQANASYEALRTARPEVAGLLDSVTSSGSLTATSDKLGRFEIAYDAPRATFEIQASLDWTKTELRELDGPRGEELIFTLVPSGSLGGVLAPSWNEVRGWSVQLRPVGAKAGQVFAPKAIKKYPEAVDDSAPKDTLLLGPPVAQSSFGWVGVPEGFYDLVFNHDALQPGNSLAIRNVAVTRGELCKDERLKAIDLGAVQPMITLELTQLDGSKMPKKSRTDYAFGSGADLVRHAEIQGSSYSFLPALLPLAVRIETEGFEPVELVAKGGVVQVSLAPRDD